MKITELTMPIGDARRILAKLDEMGDECKAVKFREMMREALNKATTETEVIIKARGAAADKLAAIGFQYVVS
jgi:hypothetical protein